MGDTLLTALSMENHHPSTILSMDSSASSSHDELDLEMNRHVIISQPPDINLPLSAEILDVGLSTQTYDTDSFMPGPKPGRKCTKRVDSIWGAWFFFTFYFRPVLNDKSKAKILRDANGLSGFEKTDLQLENFLVQHDMENMYMWAFKERPENALGKMQLRSFMNGHSRQGERVFPFGVDKGFARSHRMQRKHYRGLSNPQCVHGLELVASPNLTILDEDDRRRWTEITGRALNFTVPPEASDYGTWRNLPNTEFELERPLKNSHEHTKKLLNGSVLNLSTIPTSHGNGDAVMDLSPVGNKRKKDFFSNDEECYVAINGHDRILDLEASPHERYWLNELSGVLRNAYGPVTAAKTIYEDEEGYLIVVSLPFIDLQKVKVSWRNTLTHGIIKVSCTSTSRAPIIKRHKRTFKLTDSSQEHCPPGDFVREIPLSTRIPEDAKIEAFCDGAGAVLEILVPKLREGPEEHEVWVCLRPCNDLMLT